MKSQNLHVPEVKLTDEEKEIIVEVINDPRVVSAATCREQCFLLLSLVHNTDSEEEKTIINCDVIGEIFKPPPRLRQIVLVAHICELSHLFGGQVIKINGFIQN